jgi:hypothetical protein
MKTTIGFIVFVLLVLGLLYFISTGKKYPPLPADSRHAGITDTAVCMDCHGEGRESAMKPTHPPKFECLKCHEGKG